MKTPKRLVDPRTSLIVLAALAITTMAACGSSPEDTSIAEEMRGRGEATAQLLYGAESFMDVSPTTTYYDVETGTKSAQTQLLVVGEIVDAQVGRFFTSQDDDESLPESSEVDRADAAWATLHMIVQPDQVFDTSGRLSSTDTVTIGLAVSPNNIDQFVDELRSFGRVIAPLVEETAVFDYDPNVFAVWSGGELLGVANDDGSLTFPFASEGLADRFGLAGMTLDSVLAAASRGETVDIVTRGPLILRTDDTVTLEQNDVVISPLGE